MSNGLQKHGDETKDYMSTLWWPICKRSMALPIVHSKLHATMLTAPVLCVLYCRAGKEDDRQRRYRQRQGVRPAMVRHWGSLHRSQVPVAASPVVPGIAVEHFAPHALAWHSHAVIQTRYWREVADHQQTSLGSLTLAQKAHHTALDIVAIDPGKTPRLAITFIERRGLAVERV